MADASQGAQAKMCAEPGSAAHTFDTDSEPIDFLREDVRKHGRNIYPDGIRGTRSMPSERVRDGAYLVKGTFTVNPSPEFLDLWLPRILGASEVATDTFGLAETLPEFGLLMDRVYETFEYTDCRVSRMLLRGRSVAYGSSEPQPVEMIIEVYGKTEVTGTSYPELTLGASATDFPYIFEDTCSEIKLGGTAYECIGAEILVDNHIHPRFVNCLTATSLTPADRTVSLSLVTPATSDESALYPYGSAGSAVVKFVNGSYSCTWTMPKLSVADTSPVVRGKQEIILTLDGRAGSNAGADELVVVNDKTA